MTGKSSKTVTFSVIEADLFCLYIHFAKNVAAMNAREQDEYSDLWGSLHFDEIRKKARAIGPDATEDDFDAEREIACELTAAEIGYFVKFCARPCPGPLSMIVRQIRLKVIAARDKKGLRAVESPEGAPGAP